jgi:hypothetical protein
VALGRRSPDLARAGELLAENLGGEPLDPTSLHAQQGRAHGPMGMVLYRRAYKPL